MTDGANGTQVLVILTAKSGELREQIMRVLPDEIRETVRLYLAGEIQQWYSRADGTGVVFILNSSGVDEARALADTLPLAKAGLVNFEFIALTPLRQLGLLLNEAPRSVLAAG